MPDNNNFNELLIHTLKQIHVRLDRLEAEVDEKTDKQAIKDLQVKCDRKSNRANSKTLEKRFDRIISRLDRIISRLDRIESDIATITWMTGIGFACIGVLLVLLKPF